MSVNWPVRKNVRKFPWWNFTTMFEKYSEFKSAEKLIEISLPSLTINLNINFFE